MADLSYRRVELDLLLRPATNREVWTQTQHHPTHHLHKGSEVLIQNLIILTADCKLQSVTRLNPGDA